MSYRIVEHPSDVGFELEAETLPALLDAAVRALADVCTGGDPPPPTESRPAPALDGEPEPDVVRLLEACLLELDADDWLAVGYRDGELLGAPLAAEARANGTHVKAITWHHLSVAQTPDGWRATVFVDL